MANLLDGHESMRLWDIIDPWIDKTIFDGLSDKEAEELYWEIYDETGIELGGKLKDDAPLEVRDAFLKLQEDAIKRKETGEIID